METIKVRFNALQTLRFWAALGVVLYHAGYYTHTLAGMGGRLVSLLSHPAWSWGVYLFFAISGFVVMHSLQRNPVPQFLALRFLRIYPAFWLCVAIVVTAKLMLFGAYPWENLGLSLTLLPAGNRSYPLNVEWTLVYEVFFYLVLAVLSIPRSARLLNVFLFIWAAGIIGAANYPGNWTEFLPTYRTIFLSLFNLPFIAGVIAYQTYRQLNRLHYGLLFVAIVSFALATTWTNQILQYILGLAIAFGCLVAFAAQKALRRDIAADNLLVKFGDYSYGIYLIHVPVITILLTVLSNVSFGSQYLLLSSVTAAALSIGLVFGALEISLYKRMKQGVVWQAKLATT